MKKIRGEGDKIKMNSRIIGYSDVKWMEVAQYRIQWWALVLAILNLRVLLTDSY
jgi:hypothetical protein